MREDLTYFLSIDTGGTFTDCIAHDSSGQSYQLKVLSSGCLRSRVVSVEGKQITVLNVWGLTRDVLKGFRFTSGKFTSVVRSSTPGGEYVLLELADLPEENIRACELTAGEEAPVLAARLLTSTAIGENFPPLILRLGTTRGTNALLEGKGAQTTLYITRGFKDLLRIGDQSRPDLFALNIRKPSPLYSEVVEVDERVGASGEVLVPLAEPGGTDAESIAICLKNAFRNPAHERQLAACLNHPFTSVSTALSPRIKFLDRAETAVVNAYLSPVIHQYLKKIRDVIRGEDLFVMTSAGNLVRASSFEPKDSLLSGPAGGVVGAAETARRAGYSRILTFDMGGTSTDVARYDGDFDYRFESVIGQARLQAPALAIHTVAAGGGSICGFDGQKLFVGPESAGASPGPACYGAGGPLTITDVNLLLHRLDTSQFGIPVSAEDARARLNELLSAIEARTGTRPEAEQTLQGFIRIADETMAEAVRTISVSKGYDPADYALVAFGGAGGLHACGVARLLSVRTILLPAQAGLLSAYGISRSRLERFAERSVLQPLADPAVLASLLAELEEEALGWLKREGIADGRIRRRFLFLRLKGQESSLEIPVETVDISVLAGLFRERYEQVYGYFPENRSIEIESIRVIAGEAQEREDTTSQAPINRIPVPPAPVICREKLIPGNVVAGPCVLTDAFSTTWLDHGAEALTDADGTVRIQLLDKVQQDAGHELAELELFTHRFKAIAENMGEMLRRTSLSVNVKERLDFSCALLDAEGELIANAPHIPVHLGSLGVCVRKVREAIKMGEGDVVVTNHPGFGGSHLPDVTLITPVFWEGKRIGYVASRCHHAEMGGIRPASMPPDARNLEEEGVVIPPMYLIRKGQTRWEEIGTVLKEARYPSRSPEENLADLNAALAANREGAAGLQRLVADAGAETVRRYMEKLKAYSAIKVQEHIFRLPVGAAEEYLDDGTLLKVEMRQSDRRIIDFSGTGGVHPGNLNANEAIVQSVVMYVLRTLIPENIPLNDGLLRAVELIVPMDTILRPFFPSDPAQCPAVVGGNVETSQRLTDTLLKAFGSVACSQGTMNNTLFGNDRFGYYETVGGGVGAGPDFDGASAVHQHMTNTRITDPEILEWRYPVRLERFEIREKSGGDGRHRGGDGIRRVMEFLEPVSLSVLTQHRKTGPYGVAGGQPGAVGRQWIQRADGSVQPLDGIDGAELAPGDRLFLETPGGGGFGTPGLK